MKFSAGKNVILASTEEIIVVSLEEILSCFLVFLSNRSIFYRVVYLRAFTFSTHLQQKTMNG